MRTIGMLFTAIGLFAVVLALPALAETARKPDRGPLTRSDDGAGFGSADAPDDGDAPMAPRRPRARTSGTEPAARTLSRSSVAGKV